MEDTTTGLAPIRTAQPISDQVHDYLLEAIQQGHFAPGQKLPSENKLANELNVSRTSLREALHRLDLEGYIARKRGVGTFVIGPRPYRVDAGIEKLYSVSEIIASRGMRPGTAEVEIFVEQADEEIANQLGLKEGDPVTVVNRLRIADDVPFCWDSSRFPQHYMPSSTDPSTIGGSLFKYTKEKLGLHVSHAVTRLLPAAADEFISQKLQVPQGSLLVDLEQVHYLRDNTPVWHACVRCPAHVLSWHIVRTR